MFIHHITFVCSPSDLEEMLSLLREEIIPPLSHNSCRVQMARVHSQTADSDAESVSLQFSFESRNALACWERDLLAGTLGKFGAAYGQRMLFFRTTLETLDTGIL